MYDKNKILIGLAVFVVFMTYPFWNNIGSAAYKRPELKNRALPRNAWKVLSLCAANTCQCSTNGVTRLSATQIMIIIPRPPTRSSRRA
jgi:hypothetical protein